MILMVTGMIGTVFSSDFLTFFIFWEIMCIASYALVAFRKKNWEPVEAGLKYCVMSGSGSAFMLMGMSYLYWITGTLNFSGIAQASYAQSQNSAGFLLSLLFLVIGFGIKAAIVPFHTWLPDAHPAAPSPVSSLLSGVVIKMGIYGLIRIVIPIYTPIQPTLQTLLSILAISSMFVGNLLALVQTDLKRLLAYSSIANIGYILLGLSFGTLTGLVGSIFHVLNHALIKGLLFMVSGAFLYATGNRNLNLLTGIGKKMRTSGTIFTIGALAIIGFPLLNGFMSELYIIRACIEVEAYLPMALMLTNLVISAAYYLRTTYLIMFKNQSKEVTDIKKVPMTMLIPMIILAIFCVIIGIFPNPVVLIQKAALFLLHR
jgi:proton-translocating NADH-quinone oxidoreductase chain M